MKFYLVWETEEGRTYRFLKGVYLTEQEAKDNCKEIGAAYHSAFIDGKYHMIKNQYKWDIEEREVENPYFDIYVDRIRNGRRISNLSFNKANLLYETYVKDGSWVELQIPLKQFDGFGVSVVKTNKNDEYTKMNNYYWAGEELKEKENEFYSPSCPWGAPGMSVSDFI